MAVPATTATYIDLPNDGFTVNSAPTVIDDQHNASAAYNFDGVDDYLSTTGQVANGGETQFSLSCWVKTTAANGIILNQRSSSSVGQFTLRLNTNKLKVWAFTNGSAYTSSTGATSFNTGQWVHLCATVNGDDINLFLNGVEDTYSAQDSLAGGGFGAGGTNATLANLEVGDRSYASTVLDGDISRVKVWSGTTLSVAQVLEEYNAEFAAIGEGFAVATGNILSTITSSILTTKIVPSPVIS